MGKSNSAYKHRVATLVQINSVISRNFRERILQPQTFCHTWALQPPISEDGAKLATAMTDMNKKLETLEQLKRKGIIYDKYLEICQFTSNHQSELIVFIEPTDFVGFSLAIYTQQVLLSGTSHHFSRQVRGTDIRQFRRHVGAMTFEGDTRLSFAEIFKN